MKYVFISKIKQPATPISGFTCVNRDFFYKIHKKYLQDSKNYHTNISFSCHFPKWGYIELTAGFINFSTYFFKL